MIGLRAQAGLLFVEPDPGFTFSGGPKYHVISGARSRAQLVVQESWESLEGAPIPIRRAEPFEVKNATVVQADVICDNGVVHVINRVILPG